MLKTEVRPLSNFLKQSVVWPILTSTDVKTPFIRLKVSEFLWGYEDECACLETSSNDKESEYDPFGSFGDDFFADDEDQEEYVQNDEIKSFKVHI